MVAKIRSIVGGGFEHYCVACMFDDTRFYMPKMALSLMGKDSLHSRQLHRERSLHKSLHN